MVTQEDCITLCYSVLVESRDPHYFAKEMSGGVE